MDLLSNVEVVSPETKELCTAFPKKTKDLEVLTNTWLPRSITPLISKKA